MSSWTELAARPGPYLRQGWGQCPGRVNGLGMLPAQSHDSLGKAIRCFPSGQVPEFLEIGEI